MMRSHRVSLTVRHEAAEDVYHDRVRVAERFRGSIREGRICKVSVGKESRLLEVRGIPDGSEPVIKIGELARQALGVEDRVAYTFCMREVWWVGQFRWAWSGSDSAYRIAARLGLLGLFLGVVGVALGLIALWH